MEKKALFTAAFISVLLFSAVAIPIFVNFATANFLIYLPTIVIQSDGSTSPETEFIKQIGNVYYLTASLPQKYAISIKRSNIIFDGAGHAINGSMEGDNPPIGGYSNVGLSLEGVSNVTVKDLEVSGFINADISIENCRLCAILRVKARIFRLVDSNFNAISESNIGGEHSDLLMRFSNYNRIFGNSIASIDVGGCNSNTFFENNFACNHNHIVNEPGSWDNGLRGNYWSDYGGYDADHDGIGDTPYVIDDNNQDNYPLMAPVKVSDPLPSPVDFVSPSIAVHSPQNKTYNASNIPLNFTVNEPVSQIKCRLDETVNLTIAGNTTLTALSNGDHNVTVYATDEAGNTGVSATIFFSVEVPEPFPTAFVATASSASVAIICVGLLVYFKKRKK